MESKKEKGKTGGWMLNIILPTQLNLGIETCTL